MGQIDPSISVVETESDPSVSVVNTEDDIQLYKSAFSNLKDQGDSRETLNAYKQAFLKLLKLWSLNYVYQAKVCVFSMHFFPLIKIRECIIGLKKNSSNFPFPGEKISDD